MPNVDSALVACATAALFFVVENFNCDCVGTRYHCLLIQFTAKIQKCDCKVPTVKTLSSPITQQALHVLFWS